MSLQVPDFAAIGHQDSWDRIAAFYRAIGPAGRKPLSERELREIVPWIPPRTVSRFRVARSAEDEPTHGIYVEAFITPDELATIPSRRLLVKVHDAIAAAEREGARVAALGGFTSIVLEGRGPRCSGNMFLTTGNTLTAALIVRGVERALALLGRRLGCETLLVIGATGDVGSACATHLAGRARQLLLCARNRSRLDAAVARLCAHSDVTASTDIDAVLPHATTVIAAASTPAPRFDSGACHPHALICDAGYPRNIRMAPGTRRGQRVFRGGMGVLGGGLQSDDRVLEQFYGFPPRGAAHGCLLEGAVLAMTGRFESFSTGRGFITSERMDEIWRLATEAGVSLAPLFDDDGIWPEELAP